MNKKNAINLAASLTMTAFLTACITPPEAPEGLGCSADPRGPITIKYGVQNNKTTFEVKEKSQVKGRLGLVFKLDPKNYNKPGVPDFENSTVMLVGKATGDGKNDWFTTISGTYNSTASDGHKIGICAPPNPTQDDQTYEYMITIEGLGTLDPRVNVEPN